jgi:hypothetical protein
LVVGLINFYFSVQILRRTLSPETAPSFFEIRWQVHRNMKKYKELTRSDTGKVGFAWYGYWLSLVAIVLIVLLSILFLVEIPTR